MENVEFPCYKNYVPSDGQGFACVLIFLFSLRNCERHILCHLSQPLFAYSHISYLLGSEPKYLLPKSCASGSKLKAMQQDDKPDSRYPGRRWWFAWKNLIAKWHKYLLFYSAEKKLVETKLMEINRDVKFYL